MSSYSRSSPMRRVAIAFGLILPTLDQVSNAFVFRAPTPKPAPSSGHAATAGCVVAGQSSSLPPRARNVEFRTEGIYRQRWRRWVRRTSVGPALVSFQNGMDAAENGGPDQTFDADGDMGMAPVDLDQAMGSFSPEWSNDTVRDDPRKHLIKGSVIEANQTVFPYSIGSFPPLANSEVYYNGTAEKFWWNQNSDAVCVYVPVPKGFDQKAVEFVAKTKRISLKLDGEEILAGTTFYRIDGYDSLYVLDSFNDPPYVQLELFKVREFQNWEDLLIEDSTFSPGGAQ